MAASLTVRSVELAKPNPAKRREIPDGGLPGLYLVVQPSGSKSWAVRYRFGGSPRKLTLGSYPHLSLVDAREAARDALQTVARGRDPGMEKVTAEDTGSATRHAFGTVAAEYIQRHAKAHHRTWRETERLLLKSDLATWKNRDIRLISRRDILDVLDAVMERGSTVQANRLVTRLKPFFEWAVERGVLDASPAAGLKPPAPEISRDRVLSDYELMALWRAAETMGYPFGPAVHLLILTGVRRSEVLEAAWDEFDLDKHLWTIPRARSKTGVTHLVPLSEPACRILASLPRIGAPPSPLLFTTTGETPFSGVSKALDRLNERVVNYVPDGKPLEPWRLHDLRRTFATGCARLGVPLHVVEKSLNHTTGTFGGIVAVYQRHDFLDERRHAMATWAAHVDRLVTGALANNIVFIRR